MKKGMLFGLSHGEKGIKKTNLLHFSVSTLKNFLILELPEPSTDFQADIYMFSFAGFKNSLRIVNAGRKDCVKV